jgi:hypothetical protein
MPSVLTNRQMETLHNKRADLFQRIAKEEFRLGQAENYNNQTPLAELKRIDSLFENAQRAVNVALSHEEQAAEYKILADGEQARAGK